MMPIDTPLKSEHEKLGATFGEYFGCTLPRDYGDVAPVRGVYKGHAGQRLSVDVRVRPEVDDGGREQLSENKISTAEPEVVVERVQQPAQQQ